jgi:pSer/pThr/pTyr-binding forkhead associated (FHA) protein
MNKVIINRGSFKLNEVVFEQGTTSIGRGSDNTIVLDDTAVSNHHAKIVTLFHTSYIEDLDSTNGTLVNGKSVQKRTLHSGDVVSVGNHQLLFQSDYSAQKESEISETVMLHGSEIKQRLNEFIQAQTEQQQQTTSVRGADTSSGDKAANAALSQKGTGTKPAASKPASGSGASSLDIEKNRAWLDAYKKSQSAKKPQSATTSATTSTTTSTTTSATTPKATSSTIAAKTDNPPSAATPNTLQAGNKTKTEVKTEVETKAENKAESKVSEIKAAEIKAKNNPETTGEAGIALEI